MNPTLVTGSTSFHRLLVLAPAAALACFGLFAGADEPKQAVSGPGSAVWTRTVDAAVKYLKSAQSADGSWSGNRSPGVTGVVLTGLLEVDRLPADDATIGKALGYVESLVNPKAGHIAGKDPKVQLQNYVTSVNLMALKAAGRDDRYRKVIGDAVAFLKKLQWDEEEGKQPADDYYGGAGYDSKSRPDLSNTQYFLDALKAAGVPEDDPALKKALVFVSRCQKLKTEHNDQPWAGKAADGSFIYSAAGGGQSKVPPAADDALPGYGSMTYAGIKSMIYCGVGKDDPRMRKATEWVRRHYTVDANPGMPPGSGDRGLYYYYHTMAKCLDVLGADVVVDATGVRHDWRADITRALADRQKPDGSWVNAKDQWMEGDPNLVTGYALLALSHCRPRQK